MRVFDWIFAVVLFALGIVHCALAPFMYHSLTLGALWFFAGGLAVVFAAMLNVVRLRGPFSPLLRTFSIIANLSLLAFAVCLAIVAGFKHNPQAALFLVLMVGETLFSIARKR